MEVSNKKLSICLNNQKGSSLLIVLTLGLVIMIVGMTTMVSSSFGIQKASHRRSSVSAFNIAEAGKEHVMAKIKSQQLELENGCSLTVFNEESFNRGHYTVHCNVNDAGDTIWINSYGTLGSENKRIETILAVREEIADYDDVWDQAICANNTILVEGNGDLFGNMHCNDLLWIKGNVQWGTSEKPSKIGSSVRIYIEGNATIRGQVKAPDIDITGSEDIDVKIIASVPPMTIPTIDFSHYRDTADYYGYRYSGSHSMWDDSDLDFGEVSGGVVWIDGNVQIKKNIDYIKGGIICSGSLLIEGNIEQLVQPDDRVVPGLVSTTSYIHIKGNLKLAEGLIYSAGDMTIEGNNGESKTTGQLFCGGELWLKGNYGVFEYRYSDSVPSTTLSYAVVSWREY